MFRSHFLSLTSKTFITLLQAPVRMIFTLEDTGYAFNLPTCHLLSGIFIYEETDEEGGYIFFQRSREKSVFPLLFFRKSANSLLRMSVIGSLCWLVMLTGDFVFS